MPGRRSALRFLAFAPLALLAGCVVATETPPNPHPAIPPARSEAIPPPPGPAAVWVWEPGHWHWSGAQYAWVSGRYVRRQPDWQRWEPGHWAYQYGQWRWVPGRWTG
ncbi:MAG: hypothetical protein ACREFJ_10165 [Acetobacteraceae bacterium]